MLRVVEQDEDVARVHISVKEVVPKRLCEEDLYTVLGKSFDVGTAPLELLDVVDEHAVHAFHHHDVLAAIVPVDLGHVEQVGTGEIAANLRCISRFAHEVELIEDGLLVFTNECHRAQPVSFTPIAIGELRERIGHLDVALDARANAWSYDLDDDFLAVLQTSRMDLRDRGGCKRRLVETLEHGFDRHSVCFRDDAAGLLDRKRRNAVLKLFELICDVTRQQVAPSREHLAELHENGTELLKREPQSFPARAGAIAMYPCRRRQIESKTQRPKQVRRQDDLVQPVFHEHTLNL